MKLTYNEIDGKSWGGTNPTIIIEYAYRLDSNHQQDIGFLHNVEIRYNWRGAKRDLAFNAEELKEKVMKDLNAASVFEDKDKSKKTLQI